MSGSGWLGVLIGGLLPLFTLLIQEHSRRRQVVEQADLEKYKAIWSYRFEEFKRIEQGFAHCIADTSFTPTTPNEAEVAAEYAKKSDEALGTILGSSLIIEFDLESEAQEFFRLFSDLKPERFVDDNDEVLPPKKLEDREVIAYELRQIRHRIVERMRKGLYKADRFESMTSVKGLSVASLDRQWQQIRSKFPWNMERSGGK